MKMKKLSTIALAAAMAIGTFGFSVPAKAAENSTDYTITIPATLSVESAGWNATDGITAKVKIGDTFDSSKKLTVTAASANEWNLKSGENAIAYKMASNTEQEKSYADATATTSIDISAEDLNTGNYEAPFGIVVEDYTDKPAGEYKDTVTFTAKVENAVTTRTVTFNTATDGKTINKDGVTCRDSFDHYNNLVGWGSEFSVSSGQFTKIEVTAQDVSMVGKNQTTYKKIEGWSAATWTGKSSTVPFGVIMGNENPVTIVFTIEE